MDFDLTLIYNGIEIRLNQCGKTTDLLSHTSLTCPNHILRVLDSPVDLDIFLMRFFSSSLEIRHAKLAHNFRVVDNHVSIRADQLAVLK
jgi:hypothetical protein